MTARSPLQISDVTPAAWPDLSMRFADLGYEQSLGYSRSAASRIGGRLRLMQITRDGRLVAAAAVRLKTVPGLGRGIAWCPSGPLLRPLGAAAPEPEAMLEVLRALRHRICEEEGHVLRLRLSGTAMPGTGLDGTGFSARAAEAGFKPWTGRPPYRSFALDLTQGPDRLMQRLNGKWRGHLRFAQKSGLGLDRGFDPALQARFMALYREVEAGKGFSAEIGPEFHFAILERGEQPPDFRLEILIATKDGQDVGGVVVVTSGVTATYVFGATVEAGRSLRAGYFLTWQAVLRACEGGALWYELGGVDFMANPDVSGFKERMGGEPIEAYALEAHSAALSTTAILALEQLRARLKGRG